jgi:hypothetical protein
VLDLGLVRDIGDNGGRIARWCGDATGQDAGAESNVRVLADPKVRELYLGGGPEADVAEEETPS